MDNVHLLIDLVLAGWLGILSWKHKVLHVRVDQTAMAAARIWKLMHTPLGPIQGGGATKPGRAMLREILTKRAEAAQAAKASAEPEAAQ